MKSRINELQEGDYNESTNIEIARVKLKLNDMWGEEELYWAQRERQDWR